VKNIHHEDTKGTKVFSSFPRSCVGMSNLTCNLILKKKQFFILVLAILFLIGCNRKDDSSSHGDQFAGPVSGMTFVRIPAGSFMMGSLLNEKDRSDNDELHHRAGKTGTQHRVNVKSFYMMTTEVTQKQWREVMGKNPSNWKGDNLPVETVSWDDIQDFLKKLNRMYPGKGYRLPSEAEWEYACRAGSTTPFNTGSTISTDQANYNGNYTYGNGKKGVYREKTTKAGSFSPNKWGLYDMHGNVWEWCEDWYHNNYEKAPDDGSAWTIPSGTSRVLRGGSWGVTPRACRSAHRFRGKPNYKYPILGFRIVCVR